MAQQHGIGQLPAWQERCTGGIVSSIIIKGASAIIYGYDSKDAHIAPRLTVGRVVGIAATTLGTTTATASATTTTSTTGYTRRRSPEFIKNENGQD